MKTFKIELSGIAIVTGSVEIEAETLEAAQIKAMQNPGDVSWKYAGLKDDELIEILE